MSESQPNVNRWSIGRVGSPHIKAQVGHLEFMLFVSNSFTLGSQRECGIWWKIGLMVSMCFQCGSLKGVLFWVIYTVNGSPRFSDSSWYWRGVETIGPDHVTKVNSNLFLDFTKERSVYFGTVNRPLFSNI